MAKTKPATKHKSGARVCTRTKGPAGVPVAATPRVKGHKRTSLDRSRKVDMSSTAPRRKTSTDWLKSGSYTGGARSASFSETHTGDTITHNRFSESQFRGDRKPNESKARKRAR